MVTYSGELPPPSGSRVRPWRKSGWASASGEIIGVCGVYSRIDEYGQFPSLAHSDTHLSSDLKSVELGLGYSHDPGHWGTGYAVEACRALTGHIFRVIQPHRIVALAMADNHPSRRVMEKLGMHIERNATGADWPGYAGILYYDDPVFSDEAGGRERA